MKVRIVGWLLIVIGAVFIFSFLLSIISLFGEFNPSVLVPGILTLALGVYSLMLGSALSQHKKWSYYAGLGTFGFAAIGNVIFMFISFNFFYVLPIAIEAYTIWAIYSSKNAFLAAEAPPQQPPQPQSLPPTMPSPPPPVTN